MSTVTFDSEEGHHWTVQTQCYPSQYSTCRHYVWRDNDVDQSSMWLGYDILKKFPAAHQWDHMIQLREAEQKRFEALEKEREPMRQWQKRCREAQKLYHDLWTDPLTRNTPEMRAKKEEWMTLVSEKMSSNEVLIVGPYCVHLSMESVDGYHLVTFLNGTRQLMKANLIRAMLQKEDMTHPHFEGEKSPLGARELHWLENGFYSCTVPVWSNS